jgi:hypothetical protein
VRGCAYTGDVAAGFCSFLSALRVFATEGSENRGVMPITSHERPAMDGGRGRRLRSAGRCTFLALLAHERLAGWH